MAISKLRGENCEKQVAHRIERTPENGFECDGSSTRITRARRHFARYDGVLERHYAASWWNQGTLTLRRHYADIDANRVRAVLVRQVERGYFAVSLEVDQSLPLTCFGSAFRSDYFSAVRHAEEEYMMLKTDMIHSKKMSSRHGRLVDECYCTSIYKKIITILSVNNEFNEASIPNCYYSYINSEGDLILVRAFSYDALDVTRDLSEIRSPFL